MSESLRDRVARVLYEADPDYNWAPVYRRRPKVKLSWEELDEVSREDRRLIADALIAAGLVTGGGEPPITAFEVMATRHGLPLMLRHGAHDNQLRVRSWTHDGDRFLVEYVEVTS